MKNKNLVQNQKVTLTTKLSTGGVNPSNSVVINTLRKLFCTFFVLMSMQLSAQIPPCTGTFTPTLIIAANTNASSLSSTLIVGTHVLIMGDFNVDVSVHFVRCWVQVSGCATITINQFRSLTIDSTCVGGNTGFGVVQQRWNTIRINPTALLNVLNNSYIADADTAINSITGGSFFIDESHLVDNFVGLRISPFASTHTGVIRNSTISGSNSLMAACSGGTISEVGIHIVENSKVTIGDATINALTQIIEKQRDGILIDKSNVTILGTRIKDINYGLSGTNACVRAYSNNANYTLTVGAITSSIGTNCQMDDSYGGMLVYNGYNTNVYNSTFEELDNYGIAINPLFSNKTINIKNNTFNDVVDGTTEFEIYVNDVPSATVNIENNTFNNNATNFLGRAIMCRDNTAFFRIFQNTINDKRQGIRVNNATGSEIHSNNITGLYQVTGCYGIYVSNNTSTTVESNIITGLAALTSGVEPVGIIVDQFSQLVEVNCNELELLGYHMILYSDLNYDYFDINANVMTTGVRGIAILGDNDPDAGCIGTQGNGTTEFSDNEWLGAFGPRWLFCEDCGASGVALSVFHVRTNATFNANPNNGSSNSNFITATATPTTVALYDCSGKGLRNENTESMPDWKSADFFEGSHENILYQYNAQRYQFLIETNIPLGAEDSTFIENMNGTNIPALYEIPVLISGNNIAAAEAILNDIEPQNELEELIVRYYSIYLDKLTTEEFTLIGSDLEFITYVSELCPGLYGRIVGFAQGWLGIESEPSLVSCVDQNSKFANNSNKLATFKIFPNPILSNELFTLSGEIITKKGKIYIFDLFGREIKTIDLGQGYFSLKESLPEGMYLIRLDQENQIVKSFKLIVKN
jgi:hypothetical protein